MLNKRPSVTPEKIDTLVGQDSIFQGKLVANGALRVDGHVEGEIASKGDVVVGQSGRVHADVQARNLLVAGELKGNVRALGTVQIAASGKLEGDVQVTNLVIEEGGFFLGNCQMNRQKGPGGKEDKA